MKIVLGSYYPRLALTPDTDLGVRLSCAWQLFDALPTGREGGLVSLIVPWLACALVRKMHMQYPLLQGMNVTNSDPPSVQPLVSGPHPSITRQQH